MLHGVGSGLKDRAVGGVVSEPRNEDRAQRLGSDSYARVALEQAADPLRPRTRLHRAVHAPLWRMEEVGAALANVVKL